VTFVQRAQHVVFEVKNGAEYILAVASPGFTEAVGVNLVAIVLYMYLLGFRADGGIYIYRSFGPMGVTFLSGRIGSNTDNSKN
jgi:hypothetical protein